MSDQGSPLEPRPWGYAIPTLALALAVTTFLPPAADQLCHLSDAPVAGDSAIYEIETINATHGRQLLGPYSRLRFHHPGPLLFYLSAPLYKLISAPALPLTAWLVSFLAVLAVVRSAHRQGGVMLSCWAALLVSVWVRSLPDGAIISGWPPKVVLVPMLAFLVWCAETSVGEARVLPYAVFVASFIAQTHLGSAPLVAATGLAAVGLLLARRRESNLSRRRIVASVLVFVICWALPIWEQITRPEGNMTRMVRTLVLDPPSGRQGIEDALRATFDGCAAVPTAIANIAGVDPGAANLRGLTYVLILGLLLLTLLSTTRRRRAICGTVLLLTGIVVSIFAIRGMTGQLLRYMVLWTNSLGFLLLFLVGAVVFDAVPPGKFPMRMAPAVVAVVVGLIFLHNQQAVASYVDLPYERLGRMQHVGAAGIDRLLDDISRYRGRILFSIRGHDAWPRAAMVIAYLWRGRTDLAILPEWVPIFGDQLAPNGNERHRLALTLDRELDQRKPGYRLLAEQEGLLLYEESVITASSLRLLGAEAVVDAHGAEGDLSRLTDDYLPPEHTPWQRTPCVVFRQQGAYVELALPPHTETRLFVCADPKHVYTVLGSRDQRSFERVGTVPVERGSGLRYALVCSPHLPEYTFLRVVAESGDGRFSLAKVALLP